MAIDTLEKRLSMLVFGAGVVPHTLPEPDGTINEDDRRHLLGLFASGDTGVGGDGAEVLVLRRRRRRS